MRSNVVRKQYSRLNPSTILSLKAFLDSDAFSKYFLRQQGKIKVMKS